MAGGYRRLGGSMLLLAQFDGSQSALRTFLPLGFIQALFLLAQAVEAFARLPAH